MDSHDLLWVDSHEITWGWNHTLTLSEITCGWIPLWVKCGSLVGGAGDSLVGGFTHTHTHTHTHAHTQTHTQTHTYTHTNTHTYRHTHTHIFRDDINYICRVGQNRMYTPYLTVYLAISLPKTPYINRTGIHGSGQLYTSDFFEGIK